VNAPFRLSLKRISICTWRECFSFMLVRRYPILPMEKTIIVAPVSSIGNMLPASILWAFPFSRVLSKFLPVMFATLLTRCGPSTLCSWEFWPAANPSVLLIYVSRFLSDEAARKTSQSERLHGQPHWPPPAESKTSKMTAFQNKILNVNQKGKLKGEAA
jgi:hypothetical protein